MSISESPKTVYANVKIVRSIKPLSSFIFNSQLMDQRKVSEKGKLNDELHRITSNPNKNTRNKRLVQ